MDRLTPAAARKLLRVSKATWWHWRTRYPDFPAAGDDGLHDSAELAKWHEQRWPKGEILEDRMELPALKKLLKVSHTNWYHWKTRYPDFPEPDADGLYSLTQVLQWRERHKNWHLYPPQGEEK